MINTTRLFRSTLLAGLCCGASAASLLAQTPADQPPGDNHHHHGPPSVLFDALDTNHDGVLSTEEIANASAVLKGLLKEGQTQLTRADLRPERKDAQTPSSLHQPSGNEQAPGDDRPHDHQRMATEDQGTPLLWRHHFRHDIDGQRGERPARAQYDNERADERSQADSDREGQSDEPRRPRFEHARHFEPRTDERDEAGATREMDQVLGELHRLEREVHQLKEAQGTLAPATH